MDSLWQHWASGSVDFAKINMSVTVRKAELYTTAGCGLRSSSRHRDSVLGFLREPTKDYYFHRLLHLNRNVDAGMISRFLFRYLKDFFTSMIGATWLWTILCFAASFFSSWFLFAIVWYIVAYAHGEDDDNGDDDDNDNDDNDEDARTYLALL